MRLFDRWGHGLSRGSTKLADGEDAWRELDGVARAFAGVAERRLGEVMNMPNATDVMPRLLQIIGMLTSLVADGRESVNAELRALLEVKSEQLRLTAHELRRPLGVMNGYLSLMYVRLEDRGQAMRRQLTRIGDLVSDAIQAVEPQAAARNVTVEHVTSADLDILAAVDRRQLQIAIVNVISNAVKFTTDGSKVTVVVGADERAFTIAIMDQGPGVDPAEAERIFERWHRSPSTTAPGLGLGLSIARQIRGDT
jgi:two-component system, OmpR family, sensor histidine kinase KdpD